jgi:hypothetical protein
MKTYNHYIDGKLVGTYKEPLTNKRTFKQILGARKRRDRDARLVNILATR